MLGEGLFAGPTASLSPERPAESWLAARPRTALFGIAGACCALIVGFLGPSHFRYSLAIVIGLGVVVTVLLRPLIGGLILAGLVPIMSGLAPGVPISGVRASEALIGLIGTTLLVTARRRDAVPWGVLDWLILFYGVVWSIFGVVNALTLHEEMTFSDWGTVFGQLQFFLVYRGIRLSVRTQKERRMALGAVLVASVPVAILAIMQQLHVPGLGSFLSTITGSSEATTAAPGTVAPLSIQTMHRATGPFANWTSLAGYLFPLLVIMCSLGLGRQVGKRRWWLLAIAALAAAGLFVSDEQSAIIGLLVSVVALGALYRQTPRVLRWLLIGLVVASPIVGPTIAHRITSEVGKSASSSQQSSYVPQTLGFRGQVWTGQYIPAIEQRPFAGYGVVTPPTIQWQYTESEYVTILMEGGLPLLFVFGLLTWAMITRTWRVARSPDPFDQAVARALTVGLVALVVMDIIWPYMSNGGLPQVLFALLAILPTPLAAHEATVQLGPSPELGAGRAGITGERAPNLVPSPLASP